MSQLGVVLAYKIDKDALVRTMCVQREQKNNTCQGKCFLKKNINSSEDWQNNQNTANHQEKFEQFYFPVALHLRISMLSNTKKDRDIQIYKDPSINFSFFADIFHPPESDAILLLI